jgi:hypothetical protein
MAACSPRALMTAGSESTFRNAASDEPLADRVAVTVQPTTDHSHQNQLGKNSISRANTQPMMNTPQFDETNCPNQALATDHLAFRELRNGTDWRATIDVASTAGR